MLGLKVCSNPPRSSLSVQRWGSHIIQAGFWLTGYQRIILNLWDSCFCLPPGIRGIGHRTYLLFWDRVSHHSLVWSGTHCKHKMTLNLGQSSCLYLGSSGTQMMEVPILPGWPRSLDRSSFQSILQPDASVSHWPFLSWLRVSLSFLLALMFCNLLFNKSSTSPLAHNSAELVEEKSYQDLGEVDLFSNSSWGVSSVFLGSSSVL